MTDAISTSALGLNHAVARFDTDASRIASAGTPAEDPNPLGLESVVGDLVGARASVEANAAVMRVADRMQGRLLDIRV